MEPLDFLAVVLPRSGIYCVAELSSKKKEHYYSPTLSVAYEVARQFADAKHDTYYALASFSDEGSRAAENALYMRSAFMDIDCGEGKAYPTKRAAAGALDEFLDATLLGALGSPWIVSSGGGLHVYWPFTEDLTISRWKPVMENLKRLAKAEGLLIDFTVTADAARVLRLPGTTNWKQKAKPRECKILSVGDPPQFDFETFAAAVKAKLVTHGVTEAPIPSVIPGKRLARSPEDEAARVKLIETTEVSFKTIMLKSADGAGCEQLAYYVENAKNDGLEPLWRGLLSIAKACVDGDKAAVKLSAMHPYDTARMHAKLRDIKGPYPCTKFDSENPGVCQGCQHWGKITNPLALGRELQVDNSTQKMVVHDLITDTDQQVTRPAPPKGFSYGRAGGVFVDRKDVDDNGNETVRQFMVLSYTLFLVDILNTNNEHTIHMLAMRPEGPIRITLPQKCITSKDETLKELARQNVMPAFGSGNGKNLYEYVWACVEDASVGKRTVKVPDSYGWQDDGSFVLAGKIYTPTGTVSVPMTGLENITKNTEPRGTLDGWRAVVQLVKDRELYDILAMSLVGFGAPLMRFTGLHGMTFHLGSTASGTGKTLALELAASVWGHPTHYRVGKATSPVAMQHHLGMLHNLPLITDEITSKNRKDFEWFPEFLFDMTEGRGKERMESGANKERLNLSTWHSLTLMSSNTHVVDYLTGNRKHSSEGELRRVLEMTMPKPIHWGPDDVRIIRTLPKNYGVAGDAYAQWLVRNQQLAYDQVQSVYEKLNEGFSATNDERFWMAGLAAMVAGGVLAGRSYAGIVQFPMAQIIDRLRGMVDVARANVKSNVRSAEDILNAFTREYYGKFVIVRELQGTVQATHGDRGTIDESITRSEVLGRVEHLATGMDAYYIEERTMRAYCASMSFGYADFKRQLEQIFKVTYPRKDLLHKTKGPQMTVNTICVERPASSGVDVDESKLPVE